MKKMKKYLFGFACVCLMAMALAGRVEAKEIAGGYCGVKSENEGKNVKWSLDDNGTLTISGTGGIEAYSKLEDHPWYGYAKEIKTIDIKNGITKAGCSFCECINVETFKIPGSLTFLMGDTFDGCSSLNDISVEAGNTTYSSIEGVLYNKDKTSIFRCPEGRSGKYTIPNGVTCIVGSGRYSGAFYGCSKITEIIIPDSVEYIQGGAFDGSGIKRINVPKKVKRFNDLEWGALKFWKCPNLTEINIDKEHEQYSSIDGVVFSKDKTSLICFPPGRTGTYIIPQNVTKIDIDAFYGCSGINQVIIPEGVTRIGGEAFMSCSGLKEITIPKSVERMEGGAFDGCTDLKEVTILNSGIQIESNVFYGCDNLKDIYFNGTELQWKHALNGKKLEHANPTVHFNSENSAMTLNGTKLTLKTGATSKAIKATLTNDSIDKVTSSDNTKKIIASAKKSGNTIVIKAGKSAGKATVTVTSKSGIKCEISVTVQKKKVTTTKLTPSKTKVTLAKKGKKATITVTASPDKLSTGEAIKISMSKKDKKIASYKWDEKTGKLTITAKKKGKAKITAKAGKKSKTITVNVKK